MLISNGGYDIFIQKLNANGDLIWVKQMGGTSNDQGISITGDGDGNIYLTGNFKNTVDFDPDSGVYNLTSYGGSDMFIQKLDSLGNFLWVGQMGGSQNHIAMSIALDKQNNIYTTGYFKDTVDFDPGPAVFNLISSDASGYDIFVQKLRQCFSDSSTDTQTVCDSLTWIDGITYTANNNIATFTLTNTAGCDSVVTLDLTINTSNTATDTLTACDSITWIDGITYTANNNIATFTLTNTAGCDSVVTLDLTINTVDATVTTTDPAITANATGASYQWLDCGNNYVDIAGETAQTFTASANGDYAVEVTINSCTDTSQCITISSFVGIAENTMFTGVSIFPNPNQGLVNIVLGNLKEVSIKVFNMTGQLIYHKENINASFHQFEFNKAPGVYIVEVSSQGEKQQYKLEKR